MADVMRLVIEKTPVFIENGLSTGTNLATDDNLNDTLVSNRKSLSQCNEIWAENASLNREQEINNHNHNSNSTLQDSNQGHYSSSILKPLVFDKEVNQNHLETPSPANSSNSEGDSSSCYESSDSEEEKPTLARKSFTNPNYPGFQHLAHELNDTYNNNNNNNQVEPENVTAALNNINVRSTNGLKEIDCINKLDPEEGVKEIYSRPKLNIPLEEKEMNCDLNLVRIETATQSPKTTPVTLNTKLSPTSNKTVSLGITPKVNQLTVKSAAVINKRATIGSDTVTEETEKGEGDTKKREKLGRPQTKEGFDVYNIETALPKIDLEAIETHLRAAKEEERRRRNDREEIRRRLATGCDSDEYYGPSDKPGKKPSLQARLQSGMNLQICFMNETSSDTESPSSESAPSSRSGTPCATPSPPKANYHPEPPKSLNLTTKVRESKASFTSNGGNEDFFTRQARLQAEARLALSQAKDRARLQMEADRLSGKTSPITEMLRASLKKVGVHFPPERRRVSRQMLTDMNVAQLQVIVNDLHTQIETLNEGLVKFLMDRDELHMTQDSMLVDIEDVTRYLGAKESSLKDDIVKNNNLVPTVTSKPVITRIVSLGKK